jgi:hypothetical protein
LSKKPQDEARGKRALILGFKIAQKQAKNEVFEFYS